MAKHTRDDRPTELEALLSVVMDNPDIEITEAIYNKRKFTWDTKRIAYADVSWVIEDCEYSDDPIVIIAGERVIHYNTSCEDLFHDNPGNILSGLWTLKTLYEQQIEQEIEQEYQEKQAQTYSRQEKSFDKQVAELNNLLAQSY